MKDNFNPYQLKLLMKLMINKKIYFFNATQGERLSLGNLSKYGIISFEQDENGLFWKLTDIGMDILLKIKNKG